MGRVRVLKCPWKRHNSWDFPGGPVVKTLPPAEDSGSIPGQESKVAYAAGCTICCGGDAGTLHEGATHALSPGVGGNQGGDLPGGGVNSFARAALTQHSNRNVFSSSCGG